jgi:hypothetical protein
MKKYMAVVVLCLFSFACLSQTDLVSYNFDYCSTAPYYVLSGFSATPVSTTAPLGAGCSEGCATGCGSNSVCSVNTSFITRSWNSVSVDFTKYYQFSISSAPDVSFYLNQFIFSYRRSGTGPTSFSLYVNGVQKGLGPISGTSCSGYGVGINESYTATTTFRLYFWGGSLDGTVRLDNVRVTHSFTTLPIELVYFEANPSNDAVDLEWMTASEIDNSHYELEKSLDGVDYSKIATVDAIGNSQTLTTYYYTDHSQNAVATVYYRLKQVDYDGQFSYSHVVAVTGNLTGVINSNGVLSLREQALYDIANVYDVSGKLVYNLALGSIRLNSGVYLIELSKGGSSFHQTICIGQP